MRFTSFLAATLPVVVTMAADCFPTQSNPLDINDADNVFLDIANNQLGWDFPLALNANSYVSFTVGTVKFCVENDYLFDNTHDAQSDLAGAVWDIIQQCGTYGGSYQVNGDSGLATSVTLSAPSSDFCT